MGHSQWESISHKNSPERRAEIKSEALAELDRMGYAALRKARELTQVELAAKLGITQASVASLEARTDLQISTLARYIRAMGGELEMRAVFPEATFNLEPSSTPEPKRIKAKAHAVTFGAVPTVRGDIQPGTMNASERPAPKTVKRDPATGTFLEIGPSRAPKRFTAGSR